MAKTEVGVRLHGLRELQRALAKAEKDSRANVRLALRGIAEPIRSDAEQLAGQITNIGPRWGRMRIGVTRSLVYVAPMTRSKNPTLRRPNFGTKLLEDAMDPALEAHRFGLEAAVDKAIDLMADDFHSPP